MVHADFDTIGVADQLLDLFVLAGRLKQRHECVALIVVGRPPQDHNHQEDGGKVNVPVSLLNPQVFPDLREILR